jgi:predicted DNA-binding transcriptional regulator AlpA
VSAGSHRKPTSGGVGVSRGSGSIQLTREVDFPKPAATIGGQGAWIVQEVDAWFCHHEELRAARAASRASPEPVWDDDDW